MKQENFDTLKENEQHHNTLTKAGFIKGLNQHEKDRLLKAMHEEFIPKYSADLWCGTCVAEFVTDLYNCFKAWKDKNPEEFKRLSGVNDGIDSNLNSESIPDLRIDNTVQYVNADLAFGIENVIQPITAPVNVVMADNTTLPVLKQPVTANKATAAKTNKRR